MQLVLAPSNFGLSPLYDGHIPGTWRAPEALMDAGLGKAVSYTHLHSLPRPDYRPGAREETSIRNGHDDRAQFLAGIELILAGVDQTLVPSDSVFAF